MNDFAFTQFTTSRISEWAIFQRSGTKSGEASMLQIFSCQRELCRAKKASHSPKNHLVGKRCASLENSDSAFDVRHYQQFSVIFTRREYDLTLQDLSFSSFHCGPLLSSERQWKQSQLYSLPLFFSALEKFAEMIPFQDALPMNSVNSVWNMKLVIKELCKR